jgi:hypothetical protein
MRLGVLLVLLLGLCVLGCGIPASVADQADAVASVAAEGALLAHDAASGDTTPAFVETHTEELVRSAAELADGTESPQLRQIADRVVAALERLHAEPGDQDAAAQVARDLTRAATQAGELAKSGT